MMTFILTVVSELSVYRLIGQETSTSSCPILSFLSFALSHRPYSVYFSSFHRRKVLDYRIWTSWMSKTRFPYGFEVYNRNESSMCLEAPGGELDSEQNDKTSVDRIHSLPWYVQDKVNAWMMISTPTIFKNAPSFQVQHPHPFLPQPHAFPPR